MRNIFYILFVILISVSGCVSDIKEQENLPEQEVQNSKEPESQAVEPEFKDLVREKFNKIDINTSGREDIIAAIGAPVMYKGSQICQAEGESLDLYPQNYWMLYSNEFRIHMKNSFIDFIEISIYEFLLPNSVMLGMSIEDVFSIIGEPGKSLPEAPGSNLDKGTLYEFYDSGIKHNYYEDADTGYAYYFVANVLVVVYISGTVEHYSDTMASIQSVLNGFNIKNSGPDDIISLFGKPVSYETQNGVYSQDNLPDSYIITYPGVIHVIIEYGKIKELRIFDNFYSTKDGLHGGMDLAGVIEIAGEPDEVVESANFYALTSLSDDVLYKDINGEAGYHYWKLDNINTVLWFSNNKVQSIILPAE